MWDFLLFSGIKRRVVYVLFFGYFLLHKQKKVTDQQGMPCSQRCKQS